VIDAVESELDEKIAECKRQLRDSELPGNTEE
jgi:hypothetical protein